jgi:hypothetical protein
MFQPGDSLVPPVGHVPQVEKHFSRKWRNFKTQISGFFSLCNCFQFFPVSPHSLNYLGESWRRKFFRELVFRLVLLIRLHFYMMCLVTVEEIQEHAVHFIMVLSTCVSEGQRGWMAHKPWACLFHVGTATSVDSFPYFKITGAYQPTLPIAATSKISSTSAIFTRKGLIYLLVFGNYGFRYFVGTSNGLPGSALPFLSTTKLMCTC